MPEVAIVVGNLAYRSGQLMAIDPVSFQVARQEIRGFMRPNAVGKTPTVRMLNGQIKPVIGRVSIRGIDGCHDLGVQPCMWC